MDKSILQHRLDTVKAQIAAAALASGRKPEDITLVAATKTQSSETIRQAIEAGIAVCGENRAQELTAHLNDDAYRGAQVHFIGHLQTNKVKFVVGQVELIHSVSSEKLLRTIDAQAEKLDLVQDILLEINLAGEQAKAGFSVDEAYSAACVACGLRHVRLRGLMCIPPAAKERGKNLPYFINLAQLAVDISRKMIDNKLNMTILSMGMSNDYQDAVSAGATHIRLGTAVFGPR